MNNFAYVTGGVDRHCLGITEGLRERGHEVQWLSTESSANLEAAGQFVPLTVTSDNRNELPWRSRLNAARRAIWNPHAQRAMEELLVGFKPEVVHVHKCYVQLSVAPVMVASRNRVPLVQTVQDYEFLSASPLDSEGSRWDHRETTFSYQALNSATLLPRILMHRPRVNRWIAPSESVYRSYLSIGGIESTVIPNFAASSSDPAPPFQERDGVLYLGRLSPEKGIGHMLEAAKLLPEVRFTIAGDGSLRSEVLDAVDRLPNLVYVGFVSRAEGRKLIRGSLACLLPSLWQEPGALFCLEAMAEGTPVICYPSGGPSEFVSQSRAGIVCTRPDPSDLIEAVNSMRSDPLVWGAYSESGRTGIRDHHSLAGYMDSLERVYESAIGG